MKLKALLLALLVAGSGSSYALAKGKPPAPAAPGKKQAKILLCHKAGKSGRWVKITVATKAAEKAQQKRGDVLPDAAGTCPAPSPAPSKAAGSGAEDAVVLPVSAG